MATLACRVQFLDDTDPFNSTNFPEPSRPPLFTFREDLALGTQLAGVHRLLRAPHKVLPGGVGWAPWTQPGAAVRAAVGAPRPRASRAPWAGLGWARPQGTIARGQIPLPVGQRGSGHPPVGAGPSGAGGKERPEPGAGVAEQVPYQPEAGWRKLPGAAPLARPGGRGGARTRAVGLGPRAGTKRDAGRSGVPRDSGLLEESSERRPGQNLSQASGVATGGHATLATKHASRRHRLLLPPETPPRTPAAHGDSAQGIPLFF